MSVEIETTRVAYNGAGSTGPFDIPFYFLANSHIQAVKQDTNGVETTLTLTTDYTLTGAGDEDGGQLTLVVALATGETLTIVRNVPLTQETNWPPADPFPAESHEDAADKIMMIAQQINDKVGRTIRQPVSDTTAIAELPIAASRANMALTFDADGDPLMADISETVLSFSPTTQAFDGDGTTVAFTMSASPTSASALIVRIDGVVQTPITDYTVSGTTLTFTTAPATGTGNIVVQNFGIARELNTVAVDNVSGLGNSDGSSKVGFLQSGIAESAHRATRTVNAKLSEVEISVTDVLNSDGTQVAAALADNTSGFARAVAAAKHIKIPAGTWTIDTLALSGTGYVIEGDGVGVTILKATAASTKLLSILGSGSYATNNVFKNFTLDITDMVDDAANTALYQGFAYNNTFENVFVTGNGTNKLSYLANSPSAGQGVYTDTFISCDFGSTTGKIKLAGNSLSDAITTHLFIGCNFAHMDADYVVNIIGIGGAVQGALDKFDLANVLGFSWAADVEGTGTYLKLGTGVGHLYTQNELSGFSGTEQTGTADSQINLDFSGTRAMGIKGQTGGYTLTDTPLTLTKSGAAVHRTLLYASNATDQQVDIDFQNDGGHSYFGMLSTGEAIIDARGALQQVLLKPGGTTAVQVTSSGAVVTGFVSATTSIKSSGATSGIGYATGAGGTVAQGSGSGKATGVTLNKVTGEITMDGAILNADTTVSFTLTNTAIAAGDHVLVQHVSGGTVGSYSCTAVAAAGSATIYVRNITAGNLTEAPVLKFSIIKAVTA